MDDLPRIDTNGGSVVQGNVTTGRDFVGRDKITNIFGLARWQTYLLLLSALLIATTLLVVISPYLRARLMAPTSLPDPTHLQPVSSSRAIEITALAVDQQKLWGGAQQDGKFFLFQGNLAAGTSIGLKPLYYTENQILDLHVDCYGNLWLLINAVGTVAYNPVTGATSTVINRQTPGSTLSTDTMYAIASQCNPDGNASVWLGRAGVHTLQYDQTDRTFTQLHFVPISEDVAFQATQAISDVRGLLFTGGLVWVAGNGQKGQLLAFSPTGMTTPETFTLDEGLLTLAEPATGGAIWAGGYTKLFSVAVDRQPNAVNLVDKDHQSLNTRAHVLAIDSVYVWLGDDCSTSSNAACCPLAVYIPKDQFTTCVTKQIKNVSALTIDPAGNVWIGADSGLFVYLHRLS